MVKKIALCSTISDIIADYRVGEIAQPTPDHVRTWVRQFPSHIQKDILQEMTYALSESYITRESVVNFISGLIENQSLVTGDPSDFWRNVNFLEIQQAGNSQHDMLRLFDRALQDHVNLDIENCNSPTGPFVYLDDVIFSGNRVLNDLRPWIQDSAPTNCTIHVIVMAYHTGGQWYASSNLKRVAQSCGKNIEIHWWHIKVIEDRRSHLAESDVLRPTVFPPDPKIQAYVGMLAGEGYPPVARVVKKPPYQSLFFETEQGRQTLEQSFLQAGIEIRNMCPFLPDKIRPLGFSILKTLGFGSVIVTYRNCPNTCPPAFWAGDPWYPLLPRKTN